MWRDKTADEILNDFSVTLKNALKDGEVFQVAPLDLPQSLSDVDRMQSGPHIFVCRLPGESDKAFAMRALGFCREVETTARAVPDEPKKLN